MAKNVLTLLSFLTLFTTHAFSQEIIGEITGPSSKDNIKAISFGDSILISYSEIVSHVRVRHVKWVGKDGKTDEVFCPKDVFAIGTSQDTTFYYFIDDKSGAVKALINMKGSRSMSQHPGAVELEDRVLASFIDKSLYFILLDKNDRDVTIREIRGLTAQADRKYTLPVSLSTHIYNRTYIEFFQDESVLNSFKGRARVKLFRYAGDLFILIDDKQDAPTKKKPNQTIVLTLHPDGTVEHRVFPHLEKSIFSSYILDGKLFRSAMSAESYTLSVYDLGTQELLSKQEIHVGSGILDTKKDTLKIMTRLGQQKVIIRESFDYVMKVSKYCVPSLVVFHDRSGYLVQGGTYYNDGGSAPFIGNANPLVALMSLAIRTAIVETMEGPGISRSLFYHGGTPGSGIEPVTDPNAFLRLRIDAYERSKQFVRKKYQESPFDHKSYVPFKEGVMGIYSLKKDKSIQFVYFR